MAVTPELEAPPRAEAVEEARRPASPAAPTDHAPIWPWVRLAALLVVAVASELVYVVIWPLSYLMTQAVDFTYEYLVEYPAAWERLVLLLARLEEIWPGSTGSLDVLVDLLVRTFIAAFVLYLAAFFLTRARLPRGWGVVAVLAPPLAFQITLFTMPGLFTTDMFSYATYGQIAGVYGVSPYTHLPSQFPEFRILSWIHPLWHDAPSIYGPAWVDLTRPLARAINGWSDVDKVLAYKLVTNVGYLASVACIGYIVHRLRPGRALEAIVLFAWNPLMLFEFAGNGHNDAVMIAVMLLAVACYVSGAHWLGMVALTVSFLIKMTSVLLVPYYAMAWARDQRGWLRFFGIGFGAVATVLAVIVAFYWPWWEGVQTIGPILLWSQGPMFNNYVPDILAIQLASRRLAEGGAGLDPAVVLDQTRDSIKNVARLVLIAIALWELWRARGAPGMIGSGARLMLAFLLIVNTWVLPWYFTWPIALAVLLGWESLTTKVLIGFSISAPTVMYYHHFWHPYMSDSTYLFYVAPLAIAPLVWIGSSSVWLLRLVSRRVRRSTAAGKAPLSVAEVRR
jgi:alpha-1,6-mannosyltransferase